MIRDLASDEIARLLTQAEVDALQTGCSVWIKWPGGNGPHRYEVLNVGGLAYTVDDHNGEKRQHDRIEYVGVGRGWTQVFLDQPAHA